MSSNGTTYHNTCRVRVPANVSVPDNPEGACGFRIDNYPLAIPIIGEPPEERAMKIIAAMQKHLEKKHPENWRAIQIGREVLTAFLIGHAFSIEDPNGRALLDSQRLQIRMVLPAPYMPDDHIRKAIESVAAAGALTQENVFKLMCQMRGILTEIGQKPQSALVTT